MVPLPSQLASFAINISDKKIVKYPDTVLRVRGQAVGHLPDRLDPRIL